MNDIAKKFKTADEISKALDKSVDDLPKGNDGVPIIYTTPESNLKQRFENFDDFQDKIRRDNLRAFFEIELGKGRNPVDILDSVTRKR